MWRNCENAACSLCFYAPWHKPHWCQVSWFNTQWIPPTGISTWFLVENLVIFGWEEDEIKCDIQNVITIETVMASKTSWWGNFFSKQWWILTYLINIFSPAIPSVQSPCPGKQVSTKNSLYRYSCILLYLHNFNNRHRMCCIFCLSYCLLGFWSRQERPRKFVF